MAKARILMLLGLEFGCACVWAQGRTSFPIYIPRKVSVGIRPTNAQFPQIGLVKAYVSLTSGNSVTLTITDPNRVQQSFSPLTPGGKLQTLSFGRDTVTVAPRIDPTHPNRYEIDFILRSNSAINCTGTQSGSQSTYTVEVQTAGPKITSVCLDSYDGRYRSVPINTCTNAALGKNQIPIPLDDPADKVASMDPVNQPTQRCVSFTNSNQPDAFRMNPRIEKTEATQKAPEGEP